MLKVRQESEDIFAIYKMCKGAIAEERRAYLKIGAYLSILCSNKNYKKLAEHINSKSDLFKELGISRSMGYNYIKTWERFGEYILNSGLDICHLRLIQLLPIVKDTKEIPAWLDKAAHQSLDDFKSEIKIAKGLPDYLECEHKEQETFSRCKRCGKWFKV